MKNLYRKDLAGVVHNHCSDYSPDATESLDHMVETAKRTGVDFIVFTDHNTVKLKEDKRDVNYDGVQVIAGTEITPDCEFIKFEDKKKLEDESNGHFLIFDLEELPSADFIEKGICQEMSDFAAEKGLASFIAHPDHKGNRAFGVPSYRCGNFNLTGYTGFGLWDLQTDWQNFAKNIPKALLGFFFAPYVLKGPEPETISRWDEMAGERSFSIIGELDQHAYRYNLFGVNFTIFKSSFAFKTIRTHVVFRNSVDIESDYKKEVLDAIKKGHAYVSLDYFKNAAGFMFEAKCDSKKYLMGDTIESSGKTVSFDISLPAVADIKVIKDGTTLIRQTGDSVSFNAEKKGAYRVEAYLKEFFRVRPWIFSNTIRVI